MDKVTDYLIDLWRNPNARRIYAWVLGLLITFVLAFISKLIAKSLLLAGVRRLVKKSKTTWDDALFQRGFFKRLCHLAPALVIYNMAPIVFESDPLGREVMQGLARIYLVMVALFSIDAFLNAVLEIYHDFEISRKIPIRGFVQVLKIVMYFGGAIFILSIILGKSPLVLFGGLGAMTAVLMLIFKDAILGLVAGVQITTNQLVRIGDWIEMPQYGADGDVIDIALTTVRIQNFDKTIVTIPSYALISHSFKNWRGMKESGGRRIKRNVNIDMTSIKICMPEMIERYKKFQYLTEYIERKQRELAEYNREQEIDDSELINGRRLTNIGTFRAYLIAYLKHHPMISRDMTFLVRHLSPTPTGLPIQIYVFCRDQVWANYEAVQADIFDHILAVIPEFDLKVFQYPTGGDLRPLR